MANNLLMGQYNMSIFHRQKLHFLLTEEEGGIPLATALCGGVGTVHLGSKAVGLWTPNSDAQQMPEEIICDIRYEPLNEAVFHKFVQAAEGKFLPARVVLFKGNNPEKIKLALKYFNYVLVPDRRIKNTPKDFRNHVLSYKSS